ncbi:hypothetical protein SSX86_022602 [Deinandra increscens subsp. villosa]|uniref:HTH myb-type domain-containing protein n=1 Tax=Deinandra increscens subsp. villosa TaxID=3103831 RepID=A0AAP0GRJ1_9ASTR
MKEDDEPNWFSKWEDDLPSPEDLTPLSQTLITADLATAFDIRTPIPHPHQPPPPPNSGEFDSADRTLKRPRLVWTPQLHKRFVDAVAHLGIKNAVPKTIMQLMGVDGLTRENVASHLQKYRLYLKRMQGVSSGGHVSGGDPATDHLFASSPVPAHFLHRNSDQFMVGNYGQLQPMYGQFGFPRNGQVEHPLVNRQNQQVMGGLIRNPLALSCEDERKVLTLFPTGDD